MWERILTQVIIFLCVWFLTFLCRWGLRFYFRMRRRRKRKLFEQELLSSKETVRTLQQRFFQNPTEFEHYVAMVFSALGYEDITVTSKSNDGGKDIIMYKEGRKCVCEVKLYSAQYKIGREKIQKLHSAMLDCDAEHAVFVTTSDYTDTARAYAGKHGIDLINGFLFNRLIRAASDTTADSRKDLQYLKDYIQENMEEWQKSDIRKADRAGAVLLFLYCIYLASYMDTVARLALWPLLAAAVLCASAALVCALKLLLRRR